MNDIPKIMSDMRQDDAALWTRSTASLESELKSEEVNVVFRRQPRPVEARHRVAYRTALLVLTLSRFNRSAAKLQNLHTLMWATRSSHTRNMFSSWWNGRLIYNTVTDRIDPDLQITINLALIDGLVSPASNGKRIRLTEKGSELARLIDIDDGLLAVEKMFLNGLERLSDTSLEKKFWEVPR